MYASIEGLNPYFIGLSTLIMIQDKYLGRMDHCLNPYFIGLSTLITPKAIMIEPIIRKSQSLFYWIIYSYAAELRDHLRLSGMSQSLFYWIIYSYNILPENWLTSDESQSLFYWIIYSYNE